MKKSAKAVFSLASVFLLTSCNIKKIVDDFNDLFSSKKQDEDMNLIALNLKMEGIYKGSRFTTIIKTFDLYIKTEDKEEYYGKLIENGWGLFIKESDNWVDQKQQFNLETVLDNTHLSMLEYHKDHQFKGTLLDTSNIIAGFNTTQHEYSDSNHKYVYDLNDDGYLFSLEEDGETIFKVTTFDTKDVVMPVSI